MLRLIGVKKSFGKVATLDHASIDVAAGEIVAVMGPSGAGKSTLLRVTAGLERPDSGVVEIGGADVTRVPPWQRGVALVPQDDALYPHLSGLANIALPLRRRGVGRAAAMARARAVALSLGIAAEAERRPGELSGGQRRRVSIARAMVTSPRVCLLDEPLSALDEPLRVQLRAELRRGLPAAGAAAVLVTHDVEDARAIADRIVRLEAGRLVPEPVVSAS